LAPRKHHDPPAPPVLLRVRCLAARLDPPAPAARDAFPAIAEQPSQNEARAALDALVDIFCDFLSVSDAARHVPVANLLTLLARPALGNGNTPVFAYDATTPGTGKTLAADAVCVIATAGPFSVVTC